MALLQNKHLREFNTNYLLTLFSLTIVHIRKSKVGCSCNKHCMNASLGHSFQFWTEVLRQTDMVLLIFHVTLTSWLQHLYFIADVNSGNVEVSHYPFLCMGNEFWLNFPSDSARIRLRRVTSSKPHSQPLQQWWQFILTLGESAGFLLLSSNVFTLLG